MNFCTYVCPDGIISMTFSWLALLENVKKNHITLKSISFKPEKKFRKKSLASELCPDNCLQFL